MKMPNWYGIEGIKFEQLGTPSGPLLHYKGCIFNESDVINALWDIYRNVSNDTMIWEEFVIANVIDYLEDIIDSEGER